MLQPHCTTTARILEVAFWHFSGLIASSNVRFAPIVLKNSTVEVEGDR
jgi:hypothetical protein